MKMKMFTMLFALSVGATATFAQKGVEDGSRFGHGQDSIRCLQNISIYTEYVKTDTVLTVSKTRTIFYSFLSKSCCCTY